MVLRETTRPSISFEVWMAARGVVHASLDEVTAALDLGLRRHTGASAGKLKSILRRGYQVRQLRSDYDQLVQSGEIGTVTTVEELDLARSKDVAYLRTRCRRLYHQRNPRIAG